MLSYFNYFNVRPTLVLFALILLIGCGEKIKESQSNESKPRTQTAESVSTEPAKLEIKDAWATPMKKGLDGAAYLSILNTGGEDWFVSVKSDIAENVVLTRVGTKPGEPLKNSLDGFRIKIEKNGNLSFVPGDWFLEMVKLKQTLKIGDHFSLVLNFEKTKPINVDVLVKKKS